MKLGLLAAEVDGYGCKDMTHLARVRDKWHSVEEYLRRAQNALRALTPDKGA